jgi:dTDP-4-amino-4,6-dideoxygalactose transaminase
MLITRHKEIADKITRQRAFGVDRHIGERLIPGIYDVNMLGFNYRMSEIEAALGIEQTKRIGGFLARRKSNYECLSSELRDIGEVAQLGSTHGGFVSSHYCLSAILEKRLAARRFDIVDHLKRKGVGTSVYYPRPVPLFTYYGDKYGYRKGDFPVAEWISDSTISLPVGPHLDAGDMRYIADTLKEAIREAKKI